MRCAGTRPTRPCLKSPSWWTPSGWASWAWPSWCSTLCAAPAATAPAPWPLSTRAKRDSWWLRMWGKCVAWIRWSSVGLKVLPRFKIDPSYAGSPTQHVTSVGWFTSRCHRRHLDFSTSGALFQLPARLPIYSISSSDLCVQILT